MKRTWKVLSVDATGTVIVPAVKPGETYKSFLDKHDPELGKKFVAEDVNRNFVRSFIRMWELQPNFGLSSSEWWKKVIHLSFNQNGEVEKALNSGLFQHIYEFYKTPQAWKIYPDALETLQELKKQDIPVMAVSNFDERLPEILQNLGLYPNLINVVQYSHNHVAKPNPKIFEISLEKLNKWLIDQGKERVNKKEVLHVGDSYEKDVMGARAAAFQCVLVCRNPEDFNETRKDVSVIQNFNELLHHS